MEVRLSMNSERSHIRGLRVTRPKCRDPQSLVAAGGRAAEGSNDGRELMTRFRAAAGAGVAATGRVSNSHGASARRVNRVIRTATAAHIQHWRFSTSVFMNSLPSTSTSDRKFRNESSRTCLPRPWKLKAPASCVHLQGAFSLADDLRWPNVSCATRPDRPA
jgi:hypothetical protein